MEGSLFSKKIQVTYLVPGLGHHLCSAPARAPDSDSAVAFFALERAAVVPVARAVRPLAAVHAAVLQERAAVVELDAGIPVALGFLSEAFPAFPSERVAALYVLPAV